MLFIAMWYINIFSDEVYTRIQKEGVYYSQSTSTWISMRYQLSHNEQLSLSGVAIVDCGSCSLRILHLVKFSRSWRPAVVQHVKCSLKSNFCVNTLGFIIFLPTYVGLLCCSQSYGCRSFLLLRLSAWSPVYLQLAISLSLHSCYSLNW